MIELYLILVVFENPGKSLFCTSLHCSGPRAIVPRYCYEAQQSYLTLFEGSFAVKGPQLWNTLPRHVKEAPTLSHFKSRLGVYLCFIPDTPPIIGYPSQTNNNSILEWRPDQFQS